MQGTDIILPADQQEGTASVLSSWLKQPGDTIEAYEPVAEIETDKVMIEVASPAPGILSEVFKQPGDPIQPGEILGRIGHETSPATASENTSAGVTRPVADGSQPRLKLSPAVRRLLKQHRLDAEQIAGTGKGGRITVRDIEEFLSREPPARNVVPPAQPADMPRTTDELTGRHVPHDMMRRLIAQRTAASLQTAPHVTSVFELDLSAVMAHRDANRDGYTARGIRLTLSAYFLAASVRAIQQVPRVNSRLREDGVELFDDANIGMVISLGDDGLVIPVLHRVQERNLLGVAAELQRLTEKARAGTLTPSELKNGTFTISNHGVSGSILASPIIINQPESAVLGIGRVEKRVIVKSVDGCDSLQIRPMCYLTLTLDHRVLDAHQANAFLAALVEILEGWAEPA